MTIKLWHPWHPEHILEKDLMLNWTLSRQENTPSQDGEQKWFAAQNVRGCKPSSHVNDYQLTNVFVGSFLANMHWTELYSLWWFGWFGSIRTACSNEDYCSPILYLGAKQRTSSPSSVTFYDMPGKVWAVCIFFVPVHTRGIPHIPMHNSRAYPGKV